MKINEKLLKWLLLLLVVISFCVNYARVFDRKMDTNGDNYHYYLLAYSLASGHGYYSTIGPKPTPHTHFPPGYPAFMSLFFMPFKANVVSLKILNGILLLISILLLFRIVRKTTGRFGLGYAFIACMLCTLHAILLRWATILMSEMLYTAISLGIIAICVDLDLEKVRQMNAWHTLRLVGLCLLVAAAYFVRTMGISIILAATLAFLVLAVKAFTHRKKGNVVKWWLPALAAVLVMFSFSVAMVSWNQRNRKVVPGWKSDYLVSFAIPAAQDLPDGKTAFWLDRIGKGLSAFVPYYIPKSVLNPHKATMPKRDLNPKDVSWIAGILVIALMVIGILSMKGLQWLLMLYFLITFSVLCLYPPQFADTRYFVPLIPLMLAATVVGLGTVIDWIFKKIQHKEARWLPPVLVFALACIPLPAYWHCLKAHHWVASFESYEDMPEMSVFQHYLDACQLCVDFPAKRLAAVLKPEIYHIYSYFHHAVPLPRSGSPEEVIKYLEDNKVDLLIMDAWYPIAYRVLIPTVSAYPERFAVLWQEGDPGRETILLGFLVPPGWQPEPQSTEE